MSTEASAPPVTRLDLKAPLTGVLVPIEQVPDPVFAQKMVGEGISIDPLSDRLLAPVTVRSATCIPPRMPSPSGPWETSRCCCTSVWTP
jgi:hypothetical protein